MKSKLIYLGTALALLLCTAGFIRLEQGTQTPRYHQHLEEPGEADLAPCASCDGTGLCTHLPIVRIETGGRKIPGAAILNAQQQIDGYELGDNGEEEILAGVSTVETPGVWRHAGDDATLTVRAFVRYRGDTSRAFQKHGYLIKLVEAKDPLQNRDLPLLGMSADNEWALHGPFLDKTLLRNYMWMNLSAQVMGYAPDVRFCELLVDGEYQGVYVLMETNTQGEGRVNLTEYTAGDPVCSYIVRIGTHLNPLKSIENFTFYTNRLEEGSQVEVLYPTTPYQTEQVQEYIRADLSEAERLLYSAEMADGSGAWRDVLDRNSFVDYYILQEFLAVSDVFNKSTYFYRDVRGKIHIGPVWDYNNVLDNFFRPIEAEGFLLSQRGWYAQLMMDEDFVERVIDRYRELRGGILSDEHLNAYIDQVILWLGGAVERNFAVWGYSFDTDSPLISQAEYRWPSQETEAQIDSVLDAPGYIDALLDALPEPVDPANYEAAAAWMRQLQSEQMTNEAIREVNPANFEDAVDRMRSYMTARGAWLDEHIDSLRQYCADSKNAARVLS